MYHSLSRYGPITNTSNSWKTRCSPAVLILPRQGPMTGYDGWYLGNGGPVYAGIMHCSPLPRHSGLFLVI